MSSGTPYIGSKISLISKAEIRYEGFLYTIDQKDSTVTLAKVISLGTEDRFPSNPVPAREEVFEYIVFRGSDIKDLHVCEAPKRVEDPAIVHNGPVQQTSQTFSHSHPNFPQSYVPFGSGGMPPFSGYSPFNFPQNGPGDHSSNQRQQTPPSLPRTPTPEPVKTQSREGRPQQKSGGQQNRPRRDSSNNRDRDNRANDNRQREQSDRIYRDYRDNRDNQNKYRKDSKENRDNKNVREQHKDSNNRYDNRKETSNRYENRRETNSRYEGRENRYNTESRDSNRRDYNEGKDEKQSGSRERRRGAPRGRGGRGNARGVARGANNRTKFTEDFDFETANAKFHKEEIEQELLKVLMKIKVKDGGNVSDNEVEEANQEPIEEKEVDELDPLPSPDKYYDRSKSFFDNISCEAMVPKANEEVIVTRRQERALNTETFGSSAAHYRPGGYRGRGWGRGRGRGRGRGGFRGNNYRGNYRGSSNRNWVDYEFDYEAAGIKNRNPISKAAAGGS